jgi:hypothetical protein
MSQTIESKNKALVLKRSTHCSTSVTTQPLSAFGRPITFYTAPISRLVAMACSISLGASRQTLKYEPGTIVAERDFVIVHERFSGHAQPVNWIAADIVRIADGVLAEHWDVIEDEVTRESPRSGLPMFGEKFGE